MVDEQQQDKTVDPHVEAGTNAYGVDLNDPRLKSAADQPDVQAENEARMRVAAGTDQPVVEQLRAAAQVRETPVALGEDDGEPADAGETKKK